MILKRIVGRIAGFFVKPVDANMLRLQHYAVIGNSINRGIRIRLDHPAEKIYLTIGDDCIISGDFIFESEKGSIAIGNHTYVGGGAFISRSSITIGNNVTIAWGGDSV